MGGFSAYTSVELHVITMIDILVLNKFNVNENRKN